MSLGTVADPGRPVPATTGVVMYGRCETDPFDQATNVCESCYGEFCSSCLVTTKGRKHPICKECTLVVSGVRPGAKPLIRGSKKTAGSRRETLRQAPTTTPAFEYFDEVEPQTPQEPELPDNEAAEDKAAEEEVAENELPEDELPDRELPEDLGAAAHNDVSAFRPPRPFVTGAGGRRRTDPAPLRPAEPATRSRSDTGAGSGNSGKGWAVEVPAPGRAASLPARNRSQTPAPHSDTGADTDAGAVAVADRADGPLPRRRSKLRPADGG